MMQGRVPEHPEEFARDAVEEGAERDDRDGSGDGECGERCRPEEQREARDEERALARRVLGVIDFDLTYARVDVMELDDGSLALSELELIEPSLFLPYSGDATRRMVAALTQSL